MDILILTDNEFLYREFREITESPRFRQHNFFYRYSYTNKPFKEKYRDEKGFLPLNVTEQAEELIKDYELIISVHCKQIFPARLVNGTRCINIHPGYNPYNRGWFPQVFSIINQKPVGVTIHLMDEALDHGPIIVQEPVKIAAWETSQDVYQKILIKELELLDSRLSDIIEKNYTLQAGPGEGNLNCKNDFYDLCKIDLKEKLSMGEAIDRLRALTFAGYKNAYFWDDEGNKIWVTVNLTREDVKSNDNPGNPLLNAQP